MMSICHSYPTLFIPFFVIHPSKLNQRYCTSFSCHGLVHIERDRTSKLWHPSDIIQGTLNLPAASSRSVIVQWFASPLSCSTSWMLSSRKGSLKVLQLNIGNSWGMIWSKFAEVRSLRCRRSINFFQTSKKGGGTYLSQLRQMKPAVKDAWSDGIVREGKATSWWSSIPSDCVDFSSRIFWGKRKMVIPGIPWVWHSGCQW